MRFFQSEDFGEQKEMSNLRIVSDALLCGEP